MPSDLDIESYDAFISHSSQDKLTARLIRGYLRSHNIIAWFDEENFEPSDPVDDEAIASKLKPAIAKCRYFIIIVSRESIRSDWVKRELKIARHLNAQENLNIQFVAILIEPLDKDGKPEWLSGIREIDISGAFVIVDRLRELRDDIGKVKPTYIGNVVPNFFKQITIESLRETIVQCPGDEMKIWFLNGGHTFQVFLMPAIEELVERRKGERFDCKVLLMDSAFLPGNRVGGGIFRRMFQRQFERVIAESRFLIEDGRQHTFVQHATTMFEVLANKYPNLSVELKLTNQIPSGRYIFVSGIGFFSPFVRSFDVNLPVFVFDRISPFFKPAEEHFDSIFESARTFKRYVP